MNGTDKRSLNLWFLELCRGSHQNTENRANWSNSVNSPMPTCSLTHSQYDYVYDVLTCYTWLDFHIIRSKWASYCDVFKGIASVYSLTRWMQLLEWSLFEKILYLACNHFRRVVGAITGRVFLYAECCLTIDIYYFSQVEVCFSFFFFCVKYLIRSPYYPDRQTVGILEE